MDNFLTAESEKDDGRREEQTSTAGKPHHESARASAAVKLGSAPSLRSNLDQSNNGLHDFISTSTAVPVATGAGALTSSISEGKKWRGIWLGSWPKRTRKTRPSVFNTASRSPPMGDGIAASTSLNGHAARSPSLRPRTRSQPHSAQIPQKIYNDQVTTHPVSNMHPNSSQRHSSRPRAIALEETYDKLVGAANKGMEPTSAPATLSNKAHRKRRHRNIEIADFRASAPVLPTPADDGLRHNFPTGRGFRPESHPVPPRPSTASSARPPSSFQTRPSNYRSNSSPKSTSPTQPLYNYIRPEMNWSLSLSPSASAGKYGSNSSTPRTSFEVQRAAASASRPTTPSARPVYPSHHSSSRPGTASQQASGGHPEQAADDPQGRLSLSDGGRMHLSDEANRQMLLNLQNRRRLGLKDEPGRKRNSVQGVFKKLGHGLRGLVSGSSSRERR